MNFIDKITLAINIITLIIALSILVSKLATF